MTHHFITKETVLASFKQQRPEEDSNTLSLSHGTHSLVTWAIFTVKGLNRKRDTARLLSLTQHQPEQDFHCGLKVNINKQKNIYSEIFFAKINKNVKILLFRAIV